MLKNIIEASFCSVRTSTRNYWGWLTMADNQANVQQLAALLRDDSAILQAGTGSITSSSHQMTPTANDVQKWFADLMSNQSPKPPKLPKLDIKELGITGTVVEKTISISPNEASSSKQMPEHQIKLSSLSHISDKVLEEPSKSLQDQFCPTNVTHADQNDKQTETSCAITLEINDTELIEREKKDVVDTLSEFPFVYEDLISEEQKINVPVSKRAAKKAEKAKKREKSMAKNSNKTDEMIKRPNFFVAFPIRNREIHDNIKKVQEDVVEINNAFKDALIKLSTLHITMLVMHIDENDKEKIEKAEELLVKCRELISSDIQQLDLKFEGLGHFSSGVLFGKIAAGEALDTLKNSAKIVREVYESSGFPIDAKSFEAHLTILKLSKVGFKTKKKCGKVTTALYEKNKNLILGHDTMDRLQLLSMTKPKDENGYYYCMKMVNLKNGDE